MGLFGNGSKDEKGCQWFFAESSGLEQGANNAMTSYFKGESDESYSSMVREAIQNSLDVKRDDADGPVEVEISWQALNVADYPNLFDMEDRFEQCKNYYPENRNAREKYNSMIQFLQENRQVIYCLKIADYNTKGMSFKQNDKSHSAGFYAFLRSAGNSSKSSVSSGGNYGYGKAALFNVSRLNTILVSTQTEDNSEIFEGSTLLSTHFFEDRKRTYCGFYDSNKGRPVTNPERIPKAFRRDKIGTSIYIVGVENNGGLDAIVKSVLKNFWLAVTEDRLKVSIISKEGVFGKESVEISCDTIAGLMNLNFPSSEDNATRHSNPRPYFEAVTRAGKDDGNVCVSEVLPLLGRVSFYLRRSEKQYDRISYMRSQKMLIFNRSFGTQYGFYGVLVVEEEQGSALLGNSENPKHNEWNPNLYSDDLSRKNCKEALKNIQDFITRVLSDIFQKKEKEYLTIDGLDDYLYIPVIGDEPGGAFEPPERSEGTESEGEIDSSVLSADEKDEPFEAKVPTGQVLIEKADDDIENFSKKRERGEAETDGTDPDAPEAAPHKSFANVFIDVARNSKDSYLPVYVQYRSYALEEDDNIVHVLVLHSEREIPNAKIVVLVGGEQFLLDGGDDDARKIKIVESSVGKTNRNTIRDFRIAEGRTKIRFRLADNLRHAIYIETYEKN